MKKYNTFAGVFTPSILTILGVIMYLRLPWIVGQGGLWMSIGIIVVAHIISFTTGLSVASIATDKKVKAGGSYYMISRSLGLPIGGTLGIALFVGMSFSISLYLIGFSESFLSFWGMEKSIHNIRLVGSASLFIVAVITIISTSLAMKTQYLIMTAILVSLVSVIFGKSNNPGFVPHLKPLPGAESFATLFGIFFPAVTGFEAGVSMSGDLQNPKRSIPIGTITAIIVGFIVYLGLAVFFAYRVDSKALSSDGDVLQKISFSVPLLLAGIWGATISSAIGSILGAPRVLQATSMDRITPSIFARGYGKTEEPRNALLLTIFIAEVGILIGELEIIARVVSMFFITAYGFLNLSCVIENWVSPDFRPEFKIPSWVGLLGTITCLIIMIQLDLLAMLGATFIMSLLFLYIKKRELNLEGGDALKSIWSSLVRYGLYNLSHGSMHQRNWRPNILLFSGGTESRPYLVQLSRALADKRGIITNFHLLEKKDENPVARSRILSDEAEESEGIFTRVMECEDVYGEISQISRFHGFSGIEPNTVFLGRAKNLSNAEKFAELICDFENMDYNVLMLDYNKERGFGDMSSVDIWWSGHGNNLSFAFSLARYLQSSVSWSSAEFRFLLISSDRSKLESMGLRLESILAEYRLHGKVKVIYNEDNKRPFYDVIQEESRGTDLVFLGLPNYRMEDVFSIDRKISHFSKSLGSILWIKASSYFHRISFGSSVVEKKKEVEQESLPGYDFGNHPIIKDLLNSNLKNLENLLIQFYDSSFSSFYDGQYYFLKKFRDEIEKTYKEIHHPPKVKKSIDYLDVDLYELLYSYGKEELVSVLEIMKQNEETAIHKLNDYLRSLPSRVSISKRVEDLKKEYEGAFSEKFLGIFPKKKHNYSIQYREIMRYFIDEFISSEVKYYSRKILEQSYEMLQEIYKLRTFVTEEKCKEFNKKEKQNRQKLFIQYLEETDILLLNIGKEELLNKKKLLSGVRVFLQRSRDIFEHPDSNRYFNKTYKHLKKNSDLIFDVKDINQKFGDSITSLVSIIEYGVLLIQFQEEVFHSTNSIFRKLEEELQKDLFDLLDSLRIQRENEITRPQAGSSEASSYYEFEFELDRYLGIYKRALRILLNNLPVSLEVMNEASINKIANGEIDTPEMMLVPLRKYMQHILDSDIIMEVEHSLEEISTYVYEYIAKIKAIDNKLISEMTKSGIMKKQVQKKVLSENFSYWELERKAFEEKSKETQRNLDNIILQSFSKIDIYHLIRESESLGYIVKRKERTRYYKRVFQSISSMFTGFLVRLLHLKNKVIVSSGMVSVVKSQEDIYQSLRRTVLENTLNKAVSKALPFYYQNVFLGKETFSKDIFIKREKEIQEAIKILEGNAGGIFVVHGYPESGKTWLMRYLSESITGKDMRLYLNPENIPYRELQDFYRLLNRQTGLQKNQVQEFLSRLDLIMIDDLELFWQRKENMNKVLKEIYEIFENNDKQVLIICSMNTYAYKLMRKTTGIDSYTLGSIECSPFTSEELMNSILPKHRVSGYGLNLEAREEEDISSFQYARFFNKLFNRSFGIIGYSLRLWILSIQKVERSTIFLDMKNLSQTEVLEDLPVLWEVLVTQLILYKSASEDELISLLGESKEEIKKALNGMLRLNILIQQQSFYFSLNPALQIQIIRAFQKKGIL